MLTVLLHQYTFVQIVKERKPSHHCGPLDLKCMRSCRVLCRDATDLFRSDKARSRHDYGGGERIRTDDPLRARQVLSQLSYTPNEPEFRRRYSTAFKQSTYRSNDKLVGLDGIEPSTSRLSGVRSDQTELQALGLQGCCNIDQLPVPLLIRSMIEATRHPMQMVNHHRAIHISKNAA